MIFLTIYVEKFDKRFGELFWQKILHKLIW
jgi:hypothetical protein